MGLSTTAKKRRNHKKQRKCGAKTRSGGKCKRISMANGRCRIHGGPSTGPPPGSQNCLRHGFYVKALMPGEEDIFDKVPVGSLDNEIRIAKLRLRRILIAERDHLVSCKKKSKKIGALRLEEVTKTVVEGEVSITTKRRSPDYARLIKEGVHMVADLENKRFQMAHAGEGLTAEEKAAAAREAMQEIINSIESSA